MANSSFLNGVSRLTMVWPKTGRRGEILSLDAQKLQETPSGQPTSIYSSPKALTYPILVGAVKASWAVLIGVLGPSAESRLFPLATCLLIGMLVTIANLQEEKPSRIYWVIGLCIGLLNSLVICGAVLGISPEVGAHAIAP